MLTKYFHLVDEMISDTFIQLNLSMKLTLESSSILLYSE